MADTPGMAAFRTVARVVPVFVLLSCCLVDLDFDNIDQGALGSTWGNACCIPRARAPVGRSAAWLIGFVKPKLRTLLFKKGNPGAQAPVEAIAKRWRRTPLQADQEPKRSRTKMVPG